jgi:preprotein translocase subunit SecE
MSAVEKLKLWLVAFIVIGVVYVAAYAEVSAGARYGLVAGGIAAALGLVVFSQAGRDLSAFARGAGVELRKVVWPGKQETLQLTGVVFLFLLATTSFLWLADFIINLLLDSLTG